MRLGSVDFLAEKKQLRRLGGADEVGQEVAAGTEICLLEVMKLFTTVVARVGGVVREICVADGGMVERDQPLVLIEPKS